MFSGVGKTAAELAAAVDAGILCVNVESEPELALLVRHRGGERPPHRHFAAGQSGHRCPDPRQDRDRQVGEQVRHSDQPRPRGLSPRRHAARACGCRASICISAARSPSCKPFDDAFALLSDFVRTLRADGHAIEHVDLGGGLGIPYRHDDDPPPDPAAYAQVVKRATRALDCTLIFEPGRLLVGNAGVLVTRVLYVKRGRGGQDLRHRRCRA